MVWKIDAPISGNAFSNPTPSEILYEFDGPKIFTTAEGSLMHLWYECGEDYEQKLVRYLVAPTNPSSIEQLKTGVRTVYEALNQPWLWAVDVKDGIAENSWVLGGLHDVPLDAKPKKETPLWPELEPLLSYRLIGQGLREGEIPANVVARAVNGATSALKGLLEVVSNTASPIGRPDEGFRRLYSVVVRRFAYNSFEITFDVPVVTEDLSFSRPDESVGLATVSLPEVTDGTALMPKQDSAHLEVQSTLPGVVSALATESSRRLELYAEGAGILSGALKWLEEERGPIEPDLGILAVLECLVPPKHGQIEEAELKGQLIPGGRSIRLTRESTTKVKRTIANRRERQRNLISTEGRVGQFDKDKLIFTIRDRLNQEPDITCSFSEDFYDDLFDAFVSDKRVVLQGRWPADRRVLEVIAIEVDPAVLHLGES